MLCKGYWLLPAAAPPVAVDDTFPQELSGPTVVPAPGMLDNDEVPCGAQATIKLISGPTKGSVALNNDGSFTYTPKGSPADDQFVYQVTCYGKVG